MYIKYIDLVALVNAKKVHINDVYYTEKGVYVINFNYRITSYKDVQSPNINIANNDLLIYDSTGNLTSKKVYSNSTLVREITFTYDSSGNLTKKVDSNKSTGKILTTNFGYDGTGNLTTKTYNN